MAVSWTAAAAYVRERLNASPLLSVVLVAITTPMYFIILRLRRNTYDLDKMPGPWHQAYPVVGNILQCLTPDFHRKILAWSDRYGGIYRVQFLWRDAVVVTDPAALAVICGRGEGGIDKAAMLYAPINKMNTQHGRPNLLTAKADEQWKIIRKAVAVSFSSQAIRGKWPVVLGKTNELLERLAALPPGASVDVDQAALRVTLDVIGLAGFNHDYNSVQQDTPAREHLLRVLPRCFTEIMMRIANPLRIVAPRLFKSGAKGSESFLMFQKEMRLLLTSMKERGQPADDDLSIAAQLFRVLGEKGIDEERILSEIGILFVEGFETTGHTTSWTLFNIATTAGVQEAVAAELDAAGLLVTPERLHPRELVQEDLKALPYLTACTKEAMRMYPVVSLMGRITERPTRIGPYMVPAGTPVGTPLFAIQNTIHNWQNPLEYKPERWMDVPLESYVSNSREDEMLNGQKGITFMPFSEGPRNCVGQSLAKMEVLTLLAKLLATFHLTLAPEMGGREGVQARESTHLTLQTKGTRGIRMLLHHRAKGAPPSLTAAQVSATAAAAAKLVNSPSSSSSSSQ